MAPRNKFTRDEMTAAAVRVVRKNGIDALTAKALADELKISTQPVFTCFGTIGDLKSAVHNEAKKLFDSYIEMGLKEEIPFLGYGTQYIRFSKEEPELYRMLFLMPSENGENNALSAMKHSQDIVRPIIMKIYNIGENDANRYSRDMWLVAHSLATLTVTGDCPYSDEELKKIMTGFSVSVLKAIKEIAGFTLNSFDRDCVFRSLTEKQNEQV